MMFMMATLASLKINVSCPSPVLRLIRSPFPWRIGLFFSSFCFVKSALFILSDPRAPWFVFLRHEETRLLSPCKLDDVIQEDEVGSGRQVVARSKKETITATTRAPGGVGTKRRINGGKRLSFLQVLKAIGSQHCT